MTIAELARRLLFRLRGRVLQLRPSGTPRGRVLLSYVTLPFFDRSERTLNTHSNRWESLEMTKAFLEKGYAVDVIDISNTSFVPQHTYTYFIDNYHHLERLAPLLGPACIKIFHATTAHWKFNNEAEAARFDDLYARRGVHLSPDRIMPPNKAIELCDIATLLGNDFTESTYAFAGKPMMRIPVSTTHTFPSPAQKEFGNARKNFIWFGGAGVIHKGLDLVVEAFAQLSDLQLTICGKIDGEKDFLQLYARELSLPNITIAGFMDPGSELFKKVCDRSIALIYPSCSEGQAGSVVLTMHAGLIPIISRESGVDTADAGFTLKENTIAEIMRTVKDVSFLPEEGLRERGVAAWRYAQEYHTRGKFSQSYRQFIDMLEAKYPV